MSAKGQALSFLKPGTKRALSTKG
jgi:hypothetical protein